jgi:hypothetical protein
MLKAFPFPPEQFPNIGTSDLADPQKTAIIATNEKARIITLFISHIDRLLSMRFWDIALHVWDISSPQV